MSNKVTNLARLTRISKACSVLRVIQINRNEFDIVCELNGLDAHLRREKGEWILDIFKSRAHIRSRNIGCNFLWASVIEQIMPIRPNQPL